MTKDTKKAASMVRTFSAILGSAWALITGILLAGTISLHSDVTPVIIYTLIVGIAGAVGAFAAWRLFRWGALLFLGTLLLMLAKSLFFDIPPGNAGFPWGYVAMTVLYTFVVFTGWNALRGSNA